MTDFDENCRGCFWKYQRSLTSSFNFKLRLTGDVAQRLKINIFIDYLYNYMSYIILATIIYECFSIVLSLLSVFIVFK